MSGSKRWIRKRVREVKRCCQSEVLKKVKERCFFLKQILWLSSHSSLYQNFGPFCTAPTLFFFFFNTFVFVSEVSVSYALLFKITKI